MRRSFSSGWRRSVPRPAHGASTRTASKRAGLEPGDRLRGVGADDAHAARPRRAASRASASALRGWSSIATTSDPAPSSSARWNALPPGAAQASSTRARFPRSSPAAKSVTSWAASSCTWNGSPPAARASSATDVPARTTPSGERGVGSAERPAARARARSASRSGERTVSGAGWFMPRASASASSGPSHATHSSASQRGSASATATWPAGSTASGGGSGRRGALASARSTAFT